MAVRAVFPTLSVSNASATVAIIVSETLPSLGPHEIERPFSLNRVHVTRVAVVGFGGSGNTELDFGSSQNASTSTWPPHRLTTFPLIFHDISGRSKPSMVR